MYEMGLAGQIQSFMGIRTRKETCYWYTYEKGDTCITWKAKWKQPIMIRVWRSQYAYHWARNKDQYRHVYHKDQSNTTNTLPYDVIHINGVGSDAIHVWHGSIRVWEPKS